MNSSDQSDFRAIFGPLWARKWLIVAIAALVTAGSYMYYNRQPRVYQSGTRLFLGQDQTQSLVSGTSFSGTDDRTLANQATLITSVRMGQLVAKELKVNVSPEALTSTISANPISGSDFISVIATAGDPVSAAKIANAFARVYVNNTLDTQKRTLRSAISQAQLQIIRLSGKDRESIRQKEQLQRRVDELGALLALARPSAQQVDKALPAGAPIAPQPRRNAIFGFFVGLLAASALAFTLSRLEQRRIRSADDVETLFGLPLLTVVPRIRRPKTELAGGSSVPASLREPLRRLDTTLALLDGAGAGAGGNSNGNGNGAGLRRKVILITSAERGDGKSTLVRNLALIQQEAGKRVVVLDSDLRAPTQERLMGVQRAPGLSDVLAATSPLSSALQAAQVPVAATEEQGGGDGASAGPVGTTDSVAVLAAGRPTANPPALMTGPRLGALLADIREDFDQVLIDSPPPLAVSDVLPLLSKVDGIILVSRIDHTRTRSIEKLLELLERLPNAPVIGVVANDVHPDEIQDYGYPSH